MASEKQVEELTARINRIVSLDISSLVTNPDWGTINFQESMGVLRDLVAMVKPLGSLPVRLIPDGPTREIINQLNQVIEIVEKIETFTLEGDARSQRDAIEVDLRGKIPTVYNSIAPHAAFLALYAGDLDKTIESLEGLRVQTTTEIDTFKKNLESSKKEIESIMTSAREAAGAAGVGAFSTDFEDLATNQDNEAKLWLAVTSILGLTSIIAATISLFIPIDDAATAAQIVQFTTSKLVILGILVSGTYWSSRQFRALRHQIAVNHHRATALKTFQAFVKAGAEDTTKDAVLLETTRSIFAMSPSGYLSTAGDPSHQDGLKIVEMIRSAGAQE